MPEPDRNRRMLRVLMTLISAVFVGLGALAILTEVHTASTRRQGIVTLEGDAAVQVGVLMVALGLLPLAVWAKTPLQAKVWIGICASAFGVLLLRMMVRP